MKILFAAPVSFKRVTFFISSYVVSLANAARDLGHGVRIIQTTENNYNSCIWRSLEREFIIFRYLFKSIIDLPHDLLLASQIYQEVRDYKPDLLFLYLHDTSYMHYFIERIRRLGVKIITWRGLNPQILGLGVKKLLKKVDCVFTYDPSYLAYYNHLDVMRTEIIPLGCDVSYYEKIKSDEDSKKESGVDVCFIGLFDEYRERYLKSLTDFDLGIWSWNINDFDTPLKEFNRGVAYGEKMIEIYKSSKIVLNIHREFEVSGGNYRLFEIPASGAFQLVDEKKDIGDYFKVGKEIITFRDENDLRKKVEYYLNHPDEREEIAKAGFERVKRDHTIIDRMKKIIEIVETIP